MTTRPATAKDYIVGVDGCRALACLGVFAVNYLNKVKFDSSGFLIDFGEVSGRFGIVTLIVLSGFGLSVPFWRALAEKQTLPSMTPFWARRFLRIAPLYYLCLTALIVHNEVWKEPQGWTDILLHFVFLYNYSNAFYYSLNPVFWVLAYFMHFYLVLPLLFWLGRGGTRSALVVVMLVMGLAYLTHSYLSYLAYPGASSRENFVLTKSFLAYLPHFLIGTAAGWLYLVCDRGTRFARSPLFRGFAFWLLMALLVAVLGTSIADWMELPYAVYHYPVTPIIVALFLLSAAWGSASWFLESRPIKWLALISYGMFVFHYPVINLSLRLLPKVGVNPHEHLVLTALFALCVTLCVAAVAYVLVEKPVRRISERHFG